VFFCGKDCQRAGWRAHRGRCRELATAAAEREEGGESSEGEE
jgi:hypothetical protein